MNLDAWLRPLWVRILLTIPCALLVLGTGLVQITDCFGSGARTLDFDFLAVLPVLVLVSMFLLAVWCPLRTRAAPLTCEACEYNLTGNVTGRCPECGATVTR